MQCLAGLAETETETALEGTGREVRGPEANMGLIELRAIALLQELDQAGLEAAKELRRPLALLAESTSHVGRTGCF